MLRTFDFSTLRLTGDYSADLPSNLEPIDLVLFSKGFKLHTQPFLPYHDIEARAILKDVKDGNPICVSN